MFWKFNLLTTSHIDTLLEKEDVSLRELMDEEDILQECKAQNRKLIDFLIRAENMEEMVVLITKDPEEDIEERVKYKYPNTACEVLTSDVTQINDALAGNEGLVSKLYSFLEGDKPLNPLLASFFSKVMGLLITRKSEMIFEYLKARDDFVGTLLHHIGTSAIMDLLLRLLTCIESPEIRRAVIDWLNEEHIVEKLVGSIVPSTDEDIHCNAAQSLCDIVRLGREQLSQLQDKADPDPLLTTMELEDTVAELLNNMLDGEKNESVIANGLSVIQTLLEFKKQGPEGSTEQITALDDERLVQGVNNVLLAVTPRLKDFHGLLLEPPIQTYSAMPSTIGTLEPPLGNTRLQIARLITTLVLTNTHSVNVELANIGTIGVLLDLYFKYIWNNFLHTHVVQCIYTILNNSSTLVEEDRREHPLLVQLFSECKFVQKIIDMWEENDQQESRDQGRRRGYMGHLTKMANDLVNTVEKSENVDFIKECINEIPEEYQKKWETFVSGTLTEVNKINTVELVRGHPLASSSDSDVDDFKDIPFPQDTAMQQAFSDYQLQQMTSNFIDQFGFNEDEFAEQEEKIDVPFTDRISSIDFNIQANEDNQPNATMFEQACNERIQQFDDNDSDEDIWEEKEITFSPNAQPKRPSRLPETRDDSDTSTDSEEELESPKRIVQQPQHVHGEKMDVDANDVGWVAHIDESALHAAPIAMDTSPWDSESSGKEQPEKWAEFTNKVPIENNDNWADFNSFSDLSSSGPVPRSSSPVAMDTTESNSRTASYLTQSAPASLGEMIAEINGDKSDDLDIVSITPDLEVIDKSKIVEPIMKHETLVKPADCVSEHKTEESVVPVNTDKETCEESSNKSSTGETVPEPLSTSLNSDNDEPPPLPSSSPPRENCVDESAEGSISPDSLSPPANETDDVTSCPLSPDSASCASDVLTSPSQDESFLTRGGLMRTVGPEGGEPVEPQGNGPTEESVVDTEKSCKLSQVDELRAQAKEALENYDNAIAAGASMQNGPV